MSILEHLKKINTVALGAVCLVLVASFIFGSLKLQAFGSEKEALVIDSTHVVAEIAKDIQVQEKAPKTVSSGQFVASKTGKKYYSEGCSGAKALAEKNKIFFKTEADARAAGYTPSTACKDLKTD